MEDPGRAVQLLRYEDRQHYLWGDDESGHIVDWYYLASDRLLVSLYTIPPGGSYRHSDTHKSFYAADECYYVLRGETTLHNPETGEAHTVRAGEALHFRAGTWHHGYNFGHDAVEILVAFAPLPPDITDAAAISSLATPLAEIRGGRYEYLGDWPWNAPAARAAERIRVLRRSDWLELIHGERQPVRVELFVSTENVTMGKIELPPGIVTDVDVSPGDIVGVVTDGWAGVTWQTLNRDEPSNRVKRGSLLLQPKQIVACLADTIGLGLEGNGDITPRRMNVTSEA